MGKIFVLGAFGYSNKQLDGQTIKTRNVYNLIKEKRVGCVAKLDTLDIRKKPWLVFTLVYHLLTCRTLVILPCLNNITYIFPVVFILSKLFRYEIVSICIGGWQVEYFMGNEKFKAHPLQLKYSKAIKAFLPEMVKVENDLMEMFGFTNTEVFPNFRKFELKEIPTGSSAALRLVFMARINKNKGYPAVFELSDRLKDVGIKYSITFYGQIAEEDNADFNSLLQQHADTIGYGGALNPDSIQKTLSQYDILLLPTQYYTEGFPGSILDAYIAGIPVIVTEWKHSHEFVKDGETGFIVPFKDGMDDMVGKVKLLNNDRERLLQMKYRAQEEAKRYSENAAWNVLKKYL